MIRNAGRSARPDFFGSGSAASFEAPTGAAGCDYSAVMGEPVKHGGCHFASPKLAANRRMPTSVVISTEVFS